MVPLVDGDSTTCPYCRAAVPIPEALRRHRLAIKALEHERREAAALYLSLGRAPPKALRVFAFFDSPWFWALGVGFWLTFAMFVITWAVPVVGRVFLHVSTDDLLTDQQHALLLTGGSMGSVVLGLLLSGWSQKRTVARGGLQAALASAPPTTPGGPALCRVCGAALAVPEGGLGARCDYCSADNLVQIRPEWTAKLARLRATISTEENAAVTAWRQARSSLRNSLLLRLSIGGAVVALPLVLIGSGGSSTFLGEVDLTKPPDFLPPWTRGAAYGPCTRADSTLELTACTGERCEGSVLVGLDAAQPLEVMTDGDEVSIWLDQRRVKLVTTQWETIESARGPQAVLHPPLKAWYRVTFGAEGVRPRVHYCLHQ